MVKLKREVLASLFRCTLCNNFSQTFPDTSSTFPDYPVYFPLVITFSISKTIKVLGGGGVGEGTRFQKGAAPPKQHHTTAQINATRLKSALMAQNRTVHPFKPAMLVACLPLAHKAQIPV